MPTIEPFWAAGFSFGRGHFVVNVPYDQHLPWIFQGEEISIGYVGLRTGMTITLPNDRPVIITTDVRMYLSFGRTPLYIKAQVRMG